MSNSWSYNLLLPSGVRLARERIIGIITQAQSIGFMARNPVTGKVSVMSQDGAESFDYKDLTDATSFLERGGGRIQLWKDADDIGLLFELRGENSPHNVNDAQNDGDSIAISVDGTYYRGEDRQRIITADDLQQLFVDLGSVAHAGYGYSWDEELYDLAYLHGERELFERLYIDVCARQWPSTLFWLNYFSRDYAEIVGLDDMRRLGATITTVPNGVLATFFDYPWDVDVHNLWEINQRWRQLR